MPDAPWFPLYVKDWLVATRGLTAEQRGLYMDLLCFAWEDRGVGLPTDPEALRRLTQSTPTVWKRVWPALVGKFETRDGRLVNKRLERVRDEMLAMVATRSKAGKVGAAARWQTHSDRIVLPMANTMAKHGYSHTHSHPDPQRSREELTLLSDARAPDPDALSPGQLQAAVPGLVGAWNAMADVVEPLVAVTLRSHKTATAALRAHPDLDWWTRVFAKVAVSDFLRGLVPLPDGRAFIADFFWCLTHADEIAAGRYDNRDGPARNAAALAAVLKDLA